MNRRFHCTACGKCCHGWLPLTLRDAVAHAGRFPLAMVWTPVRPTSRAHDLAARLGTTLRLPNRKSVAVTIAPTALIPPDLPCPALTTDGLCAIHDDKPSRCRTMPFYPYREEPDQADLLTPRKGWQCDVGADAPVVYADRAIVDRGDFDRERAALEEQAPVMRAYATHLLKFKPWTLDDIAKAAAKPAGGYVVTSLSSFLTATKRPDAAAIALAQLGPLRAMAERTRDMPELISYHRDYTGWITEMESVARRGGSLTEES